MCAVATHVYVYGYDIWYMRDIYIYISYERRESIFRYGNKELRKFLLRIKYSSFARTLLQQREREFRAWTSVCNQSFLPRVSRGVIDVTHNVERSREKITLG